MTDREKAIRILEGNYKSFVLRHKGELITVNELLALLKAQEARVMTLEEVKTLEENTPLYIEQCDGLHGWDVYSGVESGTNDIMTGAPWAVAEYWVWSEYGDTWRCWTSRPTDEQMEATPWE